MCSMDYVHVRELCGYVGHFLLFVSPCIILGYLLKLPPSFHFVFHLPHTHYSLHALIASSVIFPVFCLHPSLTLPPLLCQAARYTSSHPFSTSLTSNSHLLFRSVVSSHYAHSRCITSFSSSPLLTYSLLHLSQRRINSAVDSRPLLYCLAIICCSLIHFLSFNLLAMQCQHFSPSHLLLQPYNNPPTAFMISYVHISKA